MNSTWVIVGLAIGFILVVLNNKRNQRKWRERKNRDFKSAYFEKKKEKDKQ